MAIERTDHDLDRLQAALAAMLPPQVVLDRVVIGAAVRLRLERALPATGRRYLQFTFVDPAHSPSSKPEFTILGGQFGVGGHANLPENFDGRCWGDQQYAVEVARRWMVELVEDWIAPSRS